MALEGNLKDFSLDEMFRLLQSGSKSGVLHVDGPGGEGVICFAEGSLYHASVNLPVEPAAERLARSGTISEKQLRQAKGLMKIQKKDRAGRKLGQILVDEGYLEASALNDFVREQASDALFDLLRWNEGTLRFEPEEECADADLGIAISVDDAMADVARRLELWNRILEKIPSVDARFGISPSPGVNRLDIHLKPKEWLLLCHMHGGRSVRELVELTGFSDFETARILYGMYANGLVERVEQLDEVYAW